MSFLVRNSTQGFVYCVRKSGTMKKLSHAPSLLKPYWEVPSLFACDLHNNLPYSKQLGQKYIRLSMNLPVMSQELF